MVVNESPESISTETSAGGGESDLSSVRRRTTAKSEIAESDSPSKMASSEVAVNDSANDRNRIGARAESESGGESKREGFNRFAYRPSAPTHRSIKESPLSSDAIFKQVFSTSVNSRLIIENLMKYGLLISSNFWFSSRSLRDWPLLMCCLSLNFFPLAAFVVEKLVQQNQISEPGGAVLIDFFVSAVFHELCIAVPCHMFKLWAFIGIMFQVPLVIITKYLHEKFNNYMVGNMLF